MSVDRIGNGLQSLNEILSRPDLDPNPAREDFKAHHDTLDALVSLVDAELIAPLDGALAELGSQPEEAERVKNIVADRIADAAALLFAAQQSREGRRLLHAASEIATPGEVRDLITAGIGDPLRFAAVVRAWWLVNQERTDEARTYAAQVAEGAPGPLAASLRKITDAPRPIDAPPALFGLNGFGVRVYGQRDVRDDGTYVTTRYITALFVPLLPLDAYRVASAGEDGWYFLGKVDLGPVARWWRRLAALALVLAVVGYFAQRHYTSDAYRLQEAIELAGAAEAEAGPDDRAAVADEYERIVVQFPDADAEDLRPAVEGFVRASVADVPSPLTLEHLSKVELLAQRYRALPLVVRDASLVGPMVEHLRTWASDLGTDSDEALLGALTILGYAEELSGTSDIREQRYALNRALAERLAEDWPLEAIRQYVSMPEDAASIVAAGALLEELGEGPSVWIELSPTLARWDVAARGIDELSQVRATVLERVGAANERVADPQRVALLDEPQIEPLQAAIEASPGDQELAVALADQQLATGDAEGAHATLAKIGPPGHLVLSAQAALAATYVDLGRDADADALLERVLTSRLPAFESARRSYSEKADALNERILSQAQAGTLPREVQSRLETASESELPQLFSEYVDEQISADPQLSALREEYTSLVGVVGLAIQWGTVKLRRASAAEGEERQALLDGAERAFLTIGHEGSGMPAYHLGLGQVYYRLGKEEEGEAQMQILLADHPAEVQLGVAGAYRELGLLAKAREVAERVYDTQESPLKESAASLMALMASERDDTRMWLKRGNAESPSVKLRLIELDALDELDEGRYDVADEKFAEVAKGWLEQSGDDSSAYNNAAIAMLSRYECTGNVGRLREAVAALDKAHGLTPDNALVVGNLAGALESLAMAELLGPHVQLDQLRLGSNDMRGVLTALVDGPNGSALRDAMNKSRTLKRAIEYLEQGRVLAPRRPSSYGGLLHWYVLRGDVKGLQRINRALAETNLDLGDFAAANARYVDGSDDEDSLERIEQQLTQYDVIARAVDRRGSKASKAAVAWLRGQQLHERAVMTRDPEVAQQAVEAFATAAATWNGLDSDAHARALVEVAMLETLAGSTAMQAAYDERRRSHGGEGLIISLLVEDGDALTALRARPEIAEAATLRRGATAAQLQPYDWVLSRLASDDELGKQARPSIDGPRGLVWYEAAAHLDPNPETRTPSIEFLRSAI